MTLARFLLANALVCCCAGAWLCTPPALAFSLEEAMEAAAKHSLDAREDALDVEQAEENRDLARAALIPTLNLSANLTMNEAEVAIGDRTVVNQFAYGANAGLTVTLFQGPLIPEFLASDSALDAVRLNTARSAGELRLLAAQLYFQALAAQRQLRASEESLAARKRHVQRIDALLQSGDRIEMDLARAKLAESEAQSQCIQAQSTLDELLDALAMLCQREALSADELQPASLLANSAPQVLLPSESSADRADLLALQATIETTRWRTLARSLALLPTVRLLAQYELSPPSFRSPDGMSWSIGLSLSWMLYDQTLWERIDLAEVEEQRAVLQRERAIDVVERQQRSLARQLEESQAAVLVAEEALLTARRNRELAVALFEDGALSIIELDDAEDELLSAELRHSLALLQRELLAIELLHNRGELDDA
ncbi:MAG: TolC family protein [Myxococcota bacterium]|jgi:multidrug efflux system outer membrane protein|nr:TolC family protein [Myxococcota bacterium]